MKQPKSKLFLRIYILILFLLTSSSSVWAISATCAYNDPGSGGTGMGGTGMPANGSGMGGTGIKPLDEINKLQPAGKVILSQGRAVAQFNGNSRLLAKGDAVCVGETILTADKANIHIRMIDDGLIAIRPATHLKIEKYAYTGSNMDSSLIVLFDGAFQVATGKIGQQYPQNDLIKTPSGMIGVLGTDHEATVILPGDSRGHPSGTYDKVNKGITFIKTEKGEVTIHPNQVGYVASKVDLPVLLHELPGFYLNNAAMSTHGDDSSKEEKHEKIIRSTDRSAGGDGLSTSMEKPSGELPEDAEMLELPEAVESPDLPEAIELPEAGGTLEAE
ncbi:MAG TPA: hypothetical protein VMV48_09940 [Gallionellaceae bacterium]|nr:hypothetical protein [Gallionellaceae bacterium]